MRRARGAWSFAFGPMRRRGWPRFWKYPSEEGKAVKLPNFLADPQFEALRRQMGATTLGDLTLSISSERLTIAELETLVTGGSEIQSLDALRVLADGTLAYK